MEMNWAMIIELGALLVGGIIFFFRMNYILDEVKKDQSSHRTEMHSNFDELGKTLNDIKQEQAVAKESREGIKSDLKEIRRKQNGNK